MADKKGMSSVTKMLALTSTNVFLGSVADNELGDNTSKRNRGKDPGKKSKSCSEATDDLVDDCSWRIPRIHITSNESCLQRNNSYNEGMKQRADSESSLPQLPECCTPPQEKAASPGTSKKIKPRLTRTMSKSTECLHVNESCPRRKSQSKRRFNRGTSEPNVEPWKRGARFSTVVYRRGTEPQEAGGGASTLQRAKSLINIRSPFAGRKNILKASDEELSEEDKAYKDMVQCIQGQHCKFLRQLIKKRTLDINKVYPTGSLLHEAAYKGCTKCMKILLKAGAYVNLCDSEGWTPLHSAVLGRHLNSVKLLIQSTGQGAIILHLRSFKSEIFTRYFCKHQ